jgi:hypothetical protein
MQAVPTPTPSWPICLANPEAMKAAASTPMYLIRSWRLRTALVLAAISPPRGIRRKSGGAAFDFSGFCDVIDSVLLNAKQRDHLAQVPILTEHRFAGDHRWQSF